MTAKLTRGPVLFNWKAETWRDFYFRIAEESEVDTVCLGEVVCAKRAPFTAPLIPQVAERLSKAGKEVVFSTLALIMNGRDMDLVRALAADPDLMVEANDMSAVALLAGRPHVIGPFINTYNEGTLAFFAELGAVRVSLPAELPAAAMGVLAGVGVELEVQVFGRAPLAISARCYHARSRGLHKDGCRYVCEQDPDGLRLETLDGEAFLAVNGTQTLSHGYLNLIGELAALEEAGIHRFRLSPHDMDMVAVAGIFRDVLDGRLEAARAVGLLDELSGGVPFVNGFHHAAPGVDWTDPAHSIHAGFPASEQEPEDASHGA